MLAIDLDSFTQKLSTESDRACGVLGASLLEAKLGDLFDQRLRSFRKELLGKSGPLGTFSTKIRLSHALGWINDDAQSDLDTIRDIRNDFAHSYDYKLAFDSQSVRDRCSNLRTARAFIEGFDLAAEATDHRFSPAVFHAMQKTFTTARWRFQLAVEFVAQYVDEIIARDGAYSGSGLIDSLRSLSANLRPSISATCISVPER